MHVNTKKLTVSSLLLALAILLIYLGNMMESSTLFFLALASFTVGIVYREFGMRQGCIFCLAALLLGLLVIPQKLYMITFMLCALYILLSEYAWDRVCRFDDLKKRDRVYLVARIIIFNVMYLPLTLINPGLILSKEFLNRFSGVLYPALIVFGEIFLVLFDRAYCYFQRTCWDKIRRAIKL